MSAGLSVCLKLGSFCGAEPHTPPPPAQHFPTHTRFTGTHTWCRNLHKFAQRHTLQRKRWKLKGCLKVVLSDNRLAEFLGVGDFKQRDHAPNTHELPTNTLHPPENVTHFDTFALVVTNRSKPDEENGWTPPRFAPNANGQKSTRLNFPGDPWQIVDVIPRRREVAPKLKVSARHFFKSGVLAMPQQFWIPPILSPPWASFHTHIPNFSRANVPPSFLKPTPVKKMAKVCR